MGILGIGLINKFKGTWYSKVDEYEGDTTSWEHVFVPEKATEGKTSQFAPLVNICNWCK